MHKEAMQQLIAPLHVVHCIYSLTHKLQMVRAALFLQNLWEHCFGQDAAEGSRPLEVHPISMHHNIILNVKFKDFDLHFTPCIHDTEVSIWDCSGKYIDMFGMHLSTVAIERGHHGWLDSHKLHARKAIQKQTNHLAYSYCITYVKDYRYVSGEFARRKGLVRREEESTEEEEEKE